MAPLREHTLQAYLDVLASAAPAPGGGSAAALSGAQGAALGIMVTNLSIGKKKYLEHTEALTAACDTLTQLAQALLEAVDLDTEAFEAVSSAMKLPKETPEDIALRTQAIQQALHGATQSPLSICRYCVQALDAMEALPGRFNMNTASDLGTGAAMIRAAAQGAWLNVLINLSGLKDAEEVNRLLDEARTLYETAIAKADAIYALMERACLPGE